MALTLIVTNAGRAALVNAANTGTAPVTIAQVGLSATALTPLVTAVALPGEFKRLATLSGDVVDDDTIHVIVRDESTDVFTVRSLALYLADGTLFGIYGQAAVLIEKSAQAMMLLGIDVRFEDIDATDITFGDANFLNPPATTEQIGVVELATLAEAIAGIDTTRVPAAKMIKDAVTSWLNSRFGANNASIWHPGNDGSGSGLDADLLDGQHGSYYSNIPARLGFTPVQQGTGNGQLTATSVKVGWSGTRLKATVDVTDLGNLVFDGHIADVWRASNDGSGSGLDADLLDGEQGSYYTNIPGRLGYTPANRAGDTFTGPVDAYKFSLSSGSAFGSYAGDPVAALIGAASTSGTLIDGHANGNVVIGLRANDDLDAFAIVASSGAAVSDHIYDMLAFRVRRTGQADFGSATIRADGNTMWHAGNDGAGSGADADLLDGQQGSYYRDLTNSTGTLPNARVSGDYDGIGLLTSARLRLTATTGASLTSTGHAYQIGPDSGLNLIADQNEIQARNNGAPSGLYLNNNGGDVVINGGKAWHAGNDGSGSALDADLLDGQHGSYYADVEGRLGFTPVIQGGGAGQGSNTIRIGWSGTRLKAQVDSSDRGNIVFDSNISDVWRSSNDGSGSGLDADLLDGFQATAFLRDIGASQSQQGYVKLSNGLIIQWGTAAGTYTANTDIQVNYPVAFPNNILNVTGSGADAQAQVNSVVSTNYTTAPNLTRFLFRCSVAGQNRFNWIAIGN